MNLPVVEIAQYPQDSDIRWIIVGFDVKPHARQDMPDRRRLYIAVRNKPHWIYPRANLETTQKIVRLRMHLHN